MTIKLKTIKDVNDFVSVCMQHNDGEIDVKQGRQIIDGRSILGIFSLNLLDSLNVTINSENENSKIGFYNNIQKWRIIGS